MQRVNRIPEYENGPTPGWRSRVAGLLPAAALAIAVGAPANAADLDVGVATRDGPWLYEGEFDADSTLHARVGQTVVLRLEQGSGRHGSSTGQPGQNTVRLLVEKADSFQFCIPADEPHMTRLKLREGRIDQIVRGKDGARGRTVLQVRPGDNCGSADLGPGSYVLDVFHDQRHVPPGKVAFLRLPDATRIDGDPLTASTATLSLLAWRAPNNMLVRVPNGDGNLLANATTVDEYTAWQISGTSSSFQMADGVGGKVQNQANPSPVQCPPPLFIGAQRKDPNDENCDSRVLTFEFDQPNAKSFGLTGKNTAWSEDGLYGYDGAFKLNTSSLTINAVEDPVAGGSKFLVEYRGFTCTGGVCDAANLQLQKGEVALFTEEGYKGTAFVFGADIPNFSIYNSAASKGLAIGDNKARSVRVGPDTLALLYGNSAFGGALYTTAVDIPDLAATPVGSDTVSSLQVKEPRSYVLASNGCAHCDLAGIDLHGLDFTGADFTGTNLTGANLTDTVLFMATLDDAVIATATVTGADFLETSLRCTDLSDNDLTGASFALENDAIAAVNDEGRASVIAVDPASGNRELISDGGGGTWTTTRGVGTAAQGVWVASDNLVAQLIDGFRNTISYVDLLYPMLSIGSGPGFAATSDVVQAAGGELIVVDRGQAAVFTVDPASGNRTILSDRHNGSGPLLLEPIAADIAGDGTIYVTDNVRVAVMAVDPMTGDRTTVSSANTGTGPTLQSPAYVQVAADGSLLLTDGGIPALLRVDPATGDRTVVSGAGTGSGTDFVTPAGVVTRFDGSIYVVDAGLLAIFEVDPATGDRTVVSDSSTGAGDSFVQLADIALTDTATLTSRIVTDFSCRLNLARSTVNLDSVPPSTWRYLNLGGATVNGAAGATLSTEDDPVDLSGAILNAVDLSGAVLDGANFGCATVSSGDICSNLQSTILTTASLKQTNFKDAIMWGASLGRANLDGAVMSNVKLLAQSGGFTSSADLSGAFMRNVALDGADLTGVTANNVNFYSVDPGTADADSATMTNAKFENAYLAGANFNEATLQSTSWNQAVLAGANFTGAHLQVNSVVGTPTDFTGAFMQGVVFANADVTGALFNSTYWDLDSFDPKQLNIQLPISNLRFAGYWQDTTAPECAGAAYPNDNYATPTPPATDSSNKCPDGNTPSASGCTFQETPETPIDQATPKSSICTQDQVDNMDCPLPVNPDSQCTEIDICWITDIDCS